MIIIYKHLFKACLLYLAELFNALSVEYGVCLA